MRPTVAGEGTKRASTHPAVDATYQSNKTASGPINRTALSRNQIPPVVEKPADVMPPAGICRSFATQIAFVPAGRINQEAVIEHLIHNGGGVNLGDSRLGNHLQQGLGFLLVKAIVEFAARDRLGHNGSRRTGS